MFFLFYFNRLFATVLAYAVRLYTWHKFNVYVDFEALQVSLLAGRIFFKGVRYHGDNETILVHGGFVTWRYWLRSVRPCRIFQEKGDESSHSDNHRPCRISVKVSGVEAFIYNRRPVYDIIVDDARNTPSETHAAREQARSAHQSERDGYREADRQKLGSLGSQARFSKDTASQPSSADYTPSSTSRHQEVTAPSVPWFLHLFPVHVQCNTGAAVLGNENTESILTAKFKIASGDFDASPSGPLDIFKILMGFDVSGLNIQLKPNVDFKLSQSSEGNSLREKPCSFEQNAGVETAKMSRDVPGSHKFHTPWQSHRYKVSKVLGRFLSSGSLTSVVTESQHQKDVPFSNPDKPASQSNAPWHGLRRYLQDEQRDEHEEWRSVEYAKASTLADMDGLFFSFYWDVAGEVPAHPTNTSADEKSPNGNINGAEPPEYGMKLILRGGRVNYGPWTDRHRIVLQQLFFPASFAHAKIKDPLRPGDTRLSTLFNLYLAVEEDVVLCLPFREPSRDWRWKGRAAGLNKAGEGSFQETKYHNRASKKPKRRNRQRKPIARGDVRPFAWFDIRVRKGSTIRYDMDMFAGQQGYRNTLHADVSSIEMVSSLNHALLWNCGRIAMTCDLSNPLAWSGLRSWIFEIEINNLDFILLRDHTFLLVDLIQDWSEGPLPDFSTFVPYRYLLKVTFRQFNLFLNVNDANLINASDDLNDNDFVILHGRKLDADLTIPLDRLRPARNEISFDVNGFDLGFKLRLPAKNTINTLLTNKDMASLRKIELKGAYSYHSEIRAGLTETLNLDIVGRGFSIIFHGFFARQLAKIKENYFGDDIHFRTLDEYQALADKGYNEAHPLKSSLENNDLDVILDISVEDAQAFLPANIYSACDNIELSLDFANIDLRVSNYYLELMVNSSPLGLSYGFETFDGAQFIKNSAPRQLYCDGVKVFGHRLFGLPPREPPYFSSWDINAGAFAGECSTAFLEMAIHAAQAFILGVTDKENAMPIPQMIDVHDTTFVRFHCPLLKILLPVENDALLLSIQDISGTFNDFAGEKFSQRLQMNIPKVSLACINQSLPTAQQNILEKESTLAYLDTSLSFEMVQQDARFGLGKRAQQKHIKSHDSRHPRALFLVSVPLDASTSIGREPASIPLPCLPEPLRSTSKQRRATQRGWDCTASDQVYVLAESFEGSSIASYDPIQDVFDLPLVRRRITESPSYGQCPLRAIPKSHTQVHGDRSSTLNPDAATVPADSRRVYISNDHFHSFIAPDLMLNSTYVNTENVPDLEPSLKELAAPVGSQDKEDNIFRDDQENEAHTSLIFRAIPGVSAICKPQAVITMSCLLRAIAPSQPEQVLDDYQFETLTKLLAIGPQEDDKSTFDVSIRVPIVHVRVFNPGLSDRDNNDVFNFILEGCATCVRVKTIYEAENAESMKAVHLSIASIHLDGQDGLNTKYPLRTSIDDILVWLSESDRTSIHASFRYAETSIACQEVGRLTALTHRLVTVANPIAPRFTDISRDMSLRRQFLVYSLVQAGENVPDPSFLTRPSYVLRSAKSHMRNFDSWKIVLRLRSIWHALHQDERLHLATEFKNNAIQFPSNAEFVVLSTLDQWRSWDAIHVKDSIAMRILYGAVGGVERLRDRSSIPLNVILRAGGFRLVVDPGGKPSELSVGGTAVAISIKPPPPSSAVKFFEEYREGISKSIQLNISKVGLHIDWSICDLIDQALTLVQRYSPEQTVSNITPAAPSSEPILTETFHFVAALDLAVINLNTPNLVLGLDANDLEFSVVILDHQKQPKIKHTNVLLAASSCSMMLRSVAGLLISSGLKRSSVWVAHEQQAKASSELPQEYLKVAADCGELEIDVKEDIFGLLEVTNRFVANEAAHMSELSTKHKVFLGERGQTERNNTQRHDAQRLLPVHLAIFFDLYRVNLDLLPDLHYATFGQTMRMSLIPDVTPGDAFQVNVDLKTQTHQLLSGTVAQPIAVVNLDLPPINALLRLEISPKILKLTATATVERIVLEGASLYALAAILGTPTVVSAIDSMKTDWLTVSHTLREVFPPSAITGSEQSKRRSITYNANAIIAGFGISVTAPTSSATSEKFETSLALGSTQMRVSNISSRNHNALPFPEIRALLGRVGVSVNRHGQAVRYCGHAKVSANFSCTLEEIKRDVYRRGLSVMVTGPFIQMTEDTIPAIVQIVNHLQTQIEGLYLSKEYKYLGRLPKIEKKMLQSEDSSRPKPERQSSRPFIFTEFEFNLVEAFMKFVVKRPEPGPNDLHYEDLLFRLKSAEFVAQGAHEARLKINDVRMELAPSHFNQSDRTSNSAMLPEVIFNVAYPVTESERKILFYAAGRALDLQLDSRFVVPMHNLIQSLSRTSDAASSLIEKIPRTPRSSQSWTKLPFSNRHLSMIFVEASFAGAVIKVQSHAERKMHQSNLQSLISDFEQGQTRSGRSSSDASRPGATLYAPGISLKSQYEHNQSDQSAVNIEIRIDGSKNTLTPAVVPAILQMSDSVNDVLRENRRQEKTRDHPKKQSIKHENEDQEPMNFQTEPEALIGKMKLSIGFRVCKQEFFMSCQPIARIDALAKFEDIYITANTIDSSDNGVFFALGATLSGLHTSLRHVYSRDATLAIDVDSIDISLMNAKHISGSTGIFAIVNVNSTKGQINAKQLQDVLLFREIWLPQEVRNTSMEGLKSGLESQDYFVRRYRQVAASSSFPWNATVAITELLVELDLGQALGKTSTTISKFWASSKKTSKSRQSLCLGVDQISVNSIGRMSGLVDLTNLKVRTSIAWPPMEDSVLQTPLIQGSVGFSELRAKIAFDYQVFAIVDITSFEFMMYNVRDKTSAKRDRLVAILDGDKIHGYCTTATGALAVSLAQAFERLIQEKKLSFEQSAKDIKKYVRRRPTVSRDASGGMISQNLSKSPSDKTAKMPISLQTDVVLTLGMVDVGAFPRTVMDDQMLKLEASGIKARFAVALQDQLIHSNLELSLGQVRVALSQIQYPTMPRTLGEITVEEVTRNATSASGGVILRVPRVVATMQTWQEQESRLIQYIFRSSFKGKIDVGWNYTRIAFIRRMWTTHSRTLASRLGKPLPESALKITGPQPIPESEENAEGAPSDENPHKITAVVNLPQSKYTYQAVQPPVIDTPQLRAMGDATPPLEWIGLHRDRLPNVTHQIIIVTLLEIAKEVEDAYSRVLGSS